MVVVFVLVFVFVICPSSFVVVVAVAVAVVVAAVAGGVVVVVVVVVIVVAASRHGSDWQGSSRGFRTGLGLQLSRGPHKTSLLNRMVSWRHFLSPVPPLLSRSASAKSQFLDPVSV